MSHLLLLHVKRVQTTELQSCCVPSLLVSIRLVVKTEPILTVNQVPSRIVLKTGPHERHQAHHRRRGVLKAVSNKGKKLFLILKGEVYVL